MHLRAQCDNDVAVQQTTPQESIAQELSHTLVLNSFHLTRNFSPSDPKIKEKHVGRKLNTFFLAGEPEILNNGTSLDTQDGDIAHITCIVRGKPRPLVRWEKKGVVIKDKDEGMAILSTSNSSVEESHLFVAVTSGGRRGEYTCVVTNKKGVSKQSFLITGEVVR